MPTIDRREIALGVQASRADGPSMELMVYTDHLQRISVRIHVSDLGQGAREAVDAGLRSLWLADDASRLVVRTGRTLGEARRAQHDQVVRDGMPWARSESEKASIVFMYSLDQGWQDTRPETMRVRHTGSWRVECESPEGYLDRVLGQYAGLVVEAGL